MSRENYLPAVMKMYKVPSDIWFKSRQKTRSHLIDSVDSKKGENPKSTCCNKTEVGMTVDQYKEY
jgi:hypothetical protein